jgi:hypothetical protein
MYDYEIRDVLNRIKAPVIDLELEIIKTTIEIKKPNFNPASFTIGKDLKFVKPPEPAKEYKTYYTLRVYARNNGKMLANYLNAYIKIPEMHLREEYESQNGISNLFMENTIRDIVDSNWVPDIGGGYSIPKYGPSRYDPILPTRSLLLKDIKIQDSVFDSDIDLEWVVYCDNAEPRNGTYKLSDIKIFEAK